MAVMAVSKPFISHLFGKSYMYVKDLLYMYEILLIPSSCLSKTFFRLIFDVSASASACYLWISCSIYVIYYLVNVPEK